MPPLGLFAFFIDLWYNVLVRRVMFNSIRFAQPNITRQVTTAKGIMGARPQMMNMHPV
jgi:hypothetical protein